MRPVDDLAQRIADVHGARGVAWLSELPQLIDEYARRWSLHVDAPFDALSYNWVAPATRSDGTQVVLKAGVPCTELQGEAAALRGFAGHGAVRLLDADVERGVLLLERAIPGTPLGEMSSHDEQVRTGATVMSALWRTPPSDERYTPLARWVAGLERLRAQFDGGAGPLPAALVDRGEATLRDLITSSPPDMLLHGDFHPGNVLSAERAPWLAIDPKGITGDPAYDAATFACSIDRATPPGELRRMLDRRLTQLVEHLSFDRQRLRAWALGHLVLSGWWSFEDHGAGWEWAFARAEALLALK